jgi:methionyl-tRNA formyltransferase
MRIAIITSRGSWKSDYFWELTRHWVANGHTVSTVYDAEEIPKGDLLFILGFTFVLPPEILLQNTHNLVVHESELPKGRGWTPIAWLVEGGSNRIPLTMIEAEKRVDAGQVYLRSEVSLEGHELVNEIRALVMGEIIEMCKRFVDCYEEVVSKARGQEGEASYFPRRNRESSRLNPAMTIAEQFDKLRIVDNHNYPAFFDYRGKRYTLKIEKAETIEIVNVKERPSEKAGG